MTKKPERKKKPERPFDDPFDADRFFDEYMTGIEDMMADFFEGAMNSGGQTKGFVYGFHMTTEPDGKPVIEEFGNAAGRENKPEAKIPEVKGAELTEREPLTDVIDFGNEIKILAELPGVEMEDIDIKTEKDAITIKVDTEKRKYAKNIKLPGAVNPESSKASYRNGMLEVTLKRA